MIEGIKKDFADLAPQLIKWRRDFHRHPEIAYQEERTSRVIREFLESLGLPVKSYARTGLGAVLEGQPGGPTVALRADMDALPLKEEGEKEFISQVPDAAHCCAHDGHMAIVMGAAKVLSERKGEFKGRIVFLFQPSEELSPGGARPMIGEGVLDGVDAIFGMHFWQSLPTGIIGVVKGPMMASSDSFSIKIVGKGGHGSMPQQTVDPIYVASQLVINIQSIVSRNADPLKPLVVSFGTINGGTVFNVIPSEVVLSGTVRTFEEEVQQLAESRLKEIVEQTCRTYGADAVVEYEKGYPPVVNDPDMVDFAVGVAEKIFGEGKARTIDPVMGAEDFSYFLQKVPGTFLFFGMGDGTEHPHHHPGFDMDEKALPQAAFLMAALAIEYLERKPK